MQINNNYFSNDKGWSNPNWINPKPTFKSKLELAKSGNKGMIINLIIDASGSMYGIRDKTISAVNEYLSDQERSGSFEDRLTVTLFNTKSENLITDSLVSNFRLNQLNYNPIGGTALYDAIGNSFWLVDQKLSLMPIENRPGVMNVIITDGEENSSHQFINSEIRELMAACEEADWASTFLGADINAFAVGSSMGFNYSNSLQFTKGKLAETMVAASAATNTTRQMKAAGISVSDMYASAAFYSDKTRGSVSE